MEFETTIKIVCADDGVHCGACEVFQHCYYFKELIGDEYYATCLDFDEIDCIRCQACLDAQKDWEEKQREK